MRKTLMQRDKLFNSDLQTQSSILLCIILLLMYVTLAVTQVYIQYTDTERLKRAKNINYYAIAYHMLSPHYADTTYLHKFILFI